MEKIRSESIFILGKFLNSQSSLSLLDSPSLSIPESVDNNNNINNSHKDKSNNEDSAIQEKEREKATKLHCNSCNVGFEEVKDQHSHYKSEWHRFNLKLKIAGANSITKEEFDALGDVSGSSSESSDSDSEKEEKDNNAEEQRKREKYLKKEINKEDKNEVSTGGKKGIEKPKKVAFVAQKGGEKVIISVWRLLFEEKKPITGVSALTTLQNSLQLQKWVILLVSGGRFAGAVFNGNSCVDHKTMHRYTVRKKQGGSQSSKDATGNAPKSAGASLRRYNETRLREDIVEILKNWKDHFTTCQYIFYFAPKGAPRSMIVFEGSPLQEDNNKEKLRKIPLPVKRPTFVETKYVHQTLSTIDFFKYEETINKIETPEEITEREREKEQREKEKQREREKQAKQKEEKEEKERRKRERKEDPIYAPIREGNLEGVKKLLEGEENYQFSVPEDADDVLTPLFVSLSIKNMDIITYLLNHTVTKEINVPIPSSNFYTPLHLASSEGEVEILKLLLESGANPTLKDINSKTPYDIAKNKEVRNALRTFAGKNMDLWDYNLAHIEPLTNEDIKEQQKKKSEKMKKKKQAQKQKKETDKKEKEKNDLIEQQKKHKEEEKRIAKDTKTIHDSKLKNLSDREKRALAAEQRFMASKGMGAICENCKNSILGVPFERLEFKYCSTKCVVDHKKIIGH